MQTDLNVYFSTIKKKDVPDVSKLACQIWHEHYPGIISTAQINYMLQNFYSGDVIQDQIARGYIWKFLKKDEENIGFFSMYINRGQRMMHISKLYLKSEYQGQGLGQYMLTHILGIARKNKFKAITLNVNKKNKKAIKAYKRFGFEVEESTVKDIGEGYVMDDFIMLMPLDKNENKVTS